MSEWHGINKILKEGIKIEELKCLNCGRRLKEYEGRFGRFLGCPNYITDEECKKTYSIDEKVESK